MIMLSTTILARPDLPTMREEIAKQVYVPSAAEQQKLTDTEYNAYRRSGLITKARVKETEETKKEVATESVQDKKETATQNQEATEKTQTPSVNQRRVRVTPRKPGTPVVNSGKQAQSATDKAK